MVRFTLTEHAPYGLEDIVGVIPYWLNENNPDAPEVQIGDNYQHGGGWRDFKGFKLLDDNSLKYPGDPAHKPWAVAKLRDDIICVYESAWVAVIRPDRSFTVARID